MPGTRKPKPTDIPEEVLDHFTGPARPMSQGDVDAITRRFKKAIVERMLGGEVTHHLGYPPGAEKPDTTTNHRNGTSGKTVITDDGALTLDVPRDRHGTFEPQLIPKHARRCTGFDDKILALYARGLTVREIQAFLAEMYAVEVSADLMDARDPFFAFPPDVRKVLYTTNALKSVHARLRKMLKTRGHFPTDEAAIKLLWLALRNITATWARRQTTGEAPVINSQSCMVNASPHHVRCDYPPHTQKFLTLSTGDAYDWYNPQIRSLRCSVAPC